MDVGGALCIIINYAIEFFSPEMVLLRAPSPNASQVAAQVLIKWNTSCRWFCGLKPAAMISPLHERRCRPLSHCNVFVVVGAAD